jgi:hypothetical protein
MGRLRGVPQGNKLSAYMKKTATQKKISKRRKKVSAWGHFSLYSEDEQTRYDREEGK